MANFNFNKAILGGRLTADPELRYTTAGVPVLSFTIATNRKTAKNEESKADFINCTAWRETAEFIAGYFHKSSNICVVGSTQTRSWTDKQGQKRSGNEVVVNEVFFVDSKNEIKPGVIENPQFEDVTGDGEFDPEPPRADEEYADNEDLPF